jgi:hypothetical protein
VKTSLGGSPPKNGCSMLDPYVVSLFIMMALPSLGRVFIWQINVPLRAAFFAWSAALWKIITMDNLRKRHVIEVNWCCMWKRNMESVDHLFLHCEVACGL